MKYSIWTNDSINNGIETSGSCVFETESKRNLWIYVNVNSITPKSHHIEIENIDEDGLPDVETIVMWGSIGGLNIGGL